MKLKNQEIKKPNNPGTDQKTGSNQHATDQKAHPLRVIQAKNVAAEFAGDDQAAPACLPMNQYQTATEIRRGGLLAKFASDGLYNQRRKTDPNDTPQDIKLSDASTMERWQCDGHTSGTQECSGEADSTQAEPSPIPKPETRIHEIEIDHGDAKGIYSVHPIARMFPLLQGRAYDELFKSLQNDSQQEACVMDGNSFLDGRNRVQILNELGIAPWVVQFADLKTGLTPAAWVMTRNLHRRHLTGDQYLAIFAKCHAWCKEEAARQPAETAATRSEKGAYTADDALRDAQAKQREAVDATATSDFPQKPADNNNQLKRGRPPGQRSEAKALAKATKQSRYRAEYMLKIREQMPELATAVEEGRLTLKEAIQDCDAKHQKKTDRPQRGDGVAVDKAKQLLSKLASKLEAYELTVFWQAVAAFVSEQTGAREDPD